MTTKVCMISIVNSIMISTGNGVVRAGYLFIFYFISFFYVVLSH